MTGRPSPSQISNSDIISYINTFYIYDMPEHLRLQNLLVNYQFTTSANVGVYDFPRNMYLTAMPPVFIAGYQSYMTQSRQNFFRNNSELQFLQQSLYTGTGTSASYTGQFLTNTPILQGFKRNPPGAFSGSLDDCQTNQINWNVVISADGPPDATSGLTPSYTLVDDGVGNLIDPQDPFIPGVTTFIPNEYATYGTINYITGAVNITSFVENGTRTLKTVPAGNAINVQYIPYVASRPQSAMFFQDQIILYPIPDQAYTVSFEAYAYPTSFLATNLGTSPQLNEWWQLLAFGAVQKIFEDNADFENMAKFRPLLEEQLRLMMRRTIVQQTPERTSTIYTEQSGMGQYSFGNMFGGQ